MQKLNYLTFFKASKNIILNENQLIKHSSKCLNFHLYFKTQNKGMW